MINKKAFEIQFNWIFVLIAGAAILLFFSAVIVKQKNASEASTRASALKDIESIITGTSVSTDTTKLIDIPSSNIEIGCNRISLGKVSKQYQSLILFAPSLIKGNKLITQTLTLNIPYRATNLLYVTSPQVRYIIIGDNNLAKEINKSLPSQTAKEHFLLYDSSKIKYFSNYKIRFVFANVNLPSTIPNSLIKIPNNDMSAVKISGDNKKGTIEFFQKSGNSFLPAGSSSYIGISSLLGAIYADALESYECSMANAFARHKLVTRIYKGKTNGLINTPSIKSDCNNVYKDARGNLNTIEDISANIETSQHLDLTSINEIERASRELSDKNKDIQKFSCPLIY